MNVLRSANVVAIRKLLGVIFIPYIIQRAVIDINFFSNGNPLETLKYNSISNNSFDEVNEEKCF